MSRQFRVIKGLLKQSAKFGKAPSQQLREEIERFRNERGVEFYEEEQVEEQEAPTGRETENPTQPVRLGGLSRRRRVH